MEFTQLDFRILVSTALFLILIGFVYPAVGFAGDSVNSSEIPEFNASSGTFEYVSESPEFPSRPSEGELEYIEGASNFEDNRETYLQRDGETDVLISFANFGTPSNPDTEVQLTIFNESGTTFNDSEIGPSDFVTLEQGDYIVSFENYEASEDNETLSVEWEIQQQPSDVSWLGRIPIIGGVASGAQQLAAVLGWIGAVIFRPIYNGMVLTTNTLIIMSNIITFMFSFVFWMIGGYGSIVSSAPAAWVGVFLAIPGIIFSFEFIKLLIIVIQTILDGIPFT